MGTEENVINVIIPEVIQTPLSSSTIDHQEWESLLEQIGTSVREDGHLIAFPTETVYGLGANALNRNAVLRIFEAKQRPLNDPVICHVSCKLYIYRVVVECLCHT